MPNTSEVLFVGQPNPQRADFGAAAVNSFAEARHYLLERQPSVLVFSGSSSPEFEEFCDFVLAHSPDSLWILACESVPPSQLIRWNNHGRVHDLVNRLDDRDVESKLKSALEAAGQLRQTRKLVEMFADQSQHLQRLSTELESRVNKRQRALRKTLSTMEETKSRLEAFHKALLGIHRASTVVQMEQLLSEALKSAVGISWVRVRFENQSMLQTQLKQNQLKHVLPIEIPFVDVGSQETLRGLALFAKEEEQEFSAAEVDFLHELVEALALALSRLHKLNEAETLKGQWQATFDSIPHPLCLVDEKFEILKLNRAFQQATRADSFHLLLGKNCFQTFFADDFQAPKGKFEAPFSFRNSRRGIESTEHFEILGESLGTNSEGQKVFLILLHDITEEVRFERRLVDASKLAELGLIGSSIAHELNNPLGGMLSFLQLIRMDMPKSNPLFPDIEGMESAVLRCRDIVLNLLSFARKQDFGDFVEVALTDIVERAVKLIELQSKSKGIAVEVMAIPTAAKINGSLNALSQVLCNILQNSIDAITEKLNKDPLYPGRIRIQFERENNQYLLKVFDNGTGIRPELQSQIFNPLFTTRDPTQYSGMGLTIAFTIIKDHHGTLEILSQTGSGTTAIIALPTI